MICFVKFDGLSLVNRFAWKCVCFFICLKENCLERGGEADVVVVVEIWQFSIKDCVPEIGKCNSKQQQQQTRTRHM